MSEDTVVTRSTDRSLVDAQAALTGPNVPANASRQVVASTETAYRTDTEDRPIDVRETVPRARTETAR